MFSDGAVPGNAATKRRRRRSINDRLLVRHALAHCLLRPQWRENKSHPRLMCILFPRYPPGRCHAASLSVDRYRLLYGRWRSRSWRRLSPPSNQSCPKWYRTIHDALFGPATDSIRSIQASSHIGSVFLPGEGTDPWLQGRSRRCRPGFRHRCLSRWPNVIVSVHGSSVEN